MAVARPLDYSIPWYYAVLKSSRCDWGDDSTTTGVKVTMSVQRGITVRTYTRRDGAESVAESLRSIGLACWIQDAAGKALVADRVAQPESVCLVVPEEDVARAYEAMDAFEKQLAQRDQDPRLTCPHCGSIQVSRHSVGFRKLMWWRVLCWNPKLPLFPREHRCMDCGKLW